MKTVSSRCATLMFALFFPGVVAAQDIGRFLPKDPHGIVVCDGPGRFAEHFKDTNIGRMVGSSEAEPIRAIATSLVELVAHAADESGSSFDVHALAKHLGSYGGRMAAAVRLDLDTWQATKQPSFFLSVVAEPDADTDLEAVVKMIEDEVDRSGASITTFDVGPGFRGILEGEGDGLTIPRIVDGHLVMFAGTKLEDRLVRAFAADSSLGAQLPESVEGTAIWAHADGALLDFVVLAADISQARRAEFYGSRGVPSGDGATAENKMARAIVDRLAFESAEFSLAPAGEFMRTTMSMRADASRRGIVDLFQPTAKSTPLAELLPAGTVDWQSLRFDLGLLLTWVLEIAEIRQEGLKEMIEGMVSDEGLDLQRDLLEAFDGQWLFITDPLLDSSLLDPDSDEEPEENMAIAIGLRDVKATEAMVEKLLRAQGLHAGRKTEDYRGVQVRHMPLLGQFRYTFLPEGLVLGIGVEGKKYLQGVVDRSLARAHGEARPELEAHVVARRDALSPSWRDLGVTDATNSVATVRTGLDLVFDQMNESLDGDEKVMAFASAFREGLDCWLRLAKQFDVLTSVTSFTAKPGMLRIEVIQ